MKKRGWHGRPLQQIIMVGVILLGGIATTWAQETPKDTVPTPLVNEAVQKEMRSKLVEKRLEQLREKARLEAEAKAKALKDSLIALGLFVDTLVQPSLDGTAKSPTGDVVIINRTVPTAYEANVITNKPATALPPIEDKEIMRRQAMAARLAEAKLRAQQAALASRAAGEIVDENSNASISTPQYMQTPPTDLRELVRMRNELKKKNMSNEITNITEPLPATISERELPNTPPPMIKTDAEGSLYPYYFPVEQLKTPVAYRYIKATAPYDTTYRLMKTLVYGGRTILVTELYNKAMNVINISREIISAKGCTFRDFITYEIDGFGEYNSVICEVNGDEFIRWQMKEGEKTAVTFNYFNSLYPNFEIETSRIRTLVSIEDTIFYQKNQFMAIVFEEEEITTLTDQNDNQERRSFVKYIHKYAKGMGIVEYTFKEDLRPAYTYKLDVVMDYDEWLYNYQKRRPKAPEKL